jgi:hypothetical protein
VLERNGEFVFDFLGVEACKVLEQTEQLPIAVHIEFRLIHVEAHANDADNNNVDNMCREAIRLNDMTPRYQTRKIALCLQPVCPV